MSVFFPFFFLKIYFAFARTHPLTMEIYPIWIQVHSKCRILFNDIGASFTSSQSSLRSIITHAAIIFRHGSPTRAGLSSSCGSNVTIQRKSRTLQLFYYWPAMTLRGTNESSNMFKGQEASSASKTLGMSDLEKISTELFMCKTNAPGKILFEKDAVVHVQKNQIHVQFCYVQCSWQCSSA